MAAATDVFENGLLSLIFENANYANVGDATGLRGSSTAGVFWIDLATSSKGDTGTQATNEIAYTSYARVSVARSTSGWSVANGVADNDAAITFPTCTGSSGTASHFGIGSDETSDGNLFIHGAITTPLAISTGITPEFAAGALDISLA